MPLKYPLTRTNRLVRRLEREYGRQMVINYLEMVAWGLTARQIKAEMKISDEFIRLASQIDPDDYYPKVNPVCDTDLP